MGARRKVKKLDNGMLDEESKDISGGRLSVSKKGAKEHKQQLERLKETQPDFYKYLEEVDKELLEFDDEGVDDDAETEADDAIEDEDDLDDDDIDQPCDGAKEEEKPARGAITMDMVDSWCNAIQENGKIAPIRSLLRVFRTACH